MNKTINQSAKYKYLLLFTSLLINLSSCTSGFHDKEPWYAEGKFPIVEKYESHATAIKEYWIVEGSDRRALAESFLKDVSARELTLLEAETLLGLKPIISDNHHLYLVRAITVRREPYPIEVYFASGEVTDKPDLSGKVEKKQFKNGVLQIVAGTHSTCMMFSPGVIRQPLIVSLQALPERVTMYYHCDAP